MILPLSPASDCARRLPPNDPGFLGKTARPVPGSSDQILNVGAGRAPQSEESTRPSHLLIDGSMVVNYMVVVKHETDHERTSYVPSRDLCASKRDSQKIVKTGFCCSLETRKPMTTPQPYMFRQDSSFLYYWASMPGMAAVWTSSGTEILSATTRGRWTSSGPAATAFAQQSRIVGVPRPCQAARRRSSRRVQAPSVHYLPPYRPKTS